jgi:membrane fusion protein, multidrug efflux system
MVPANRFSKPVMPNSPFPKSNRERMRQKIAAGIRAHFHLFALALVFALSGCFGPSGGQQPPGGPPQEVNVVTITGQRVKLTTDLPGRTSSYRVADVRPQVNGILQKRFFIEGDTVQAGQQLYQIDPAPYQAAYDSAQATLQHAQAEVTSAQFLADRDKGLVASNAVSKQDYDNAVSALLQAKADVASGEAAVETAKVNLDYTKVLSPITGITGRSVTEGALVTANQTTTLVTIQQLDPIYVDIPQSTANLLRLRREIASGQIQTTADNQAAVNLTLEDGSEYEEQGKLQFSEVTVDQGTGSVILRAVFPNPKNVLLPGMFVTAHLEEGFVDNGILIPQRGVTHDPQGQATALVVNKEDKVEQRTLTTNRAIGDKWLVTDGVQIGDKVIVAGLQKVHPGQTVKPTEVTLDASPTAQQP